MKQHDSSRGKLLKLGQVSAAVLLAIFSSQTVFAEESKKQKNGDTEVEVIEVNGSIHRSLNEAANFKRFEDQFVDAIVSSDIGKLPDTTIAESLGRIPGVQIDRGIGQGSDISIRGLRQNVTLFNGRQIFDSNGRGSNGPDQLGTSTYGILGTIPAALISRMEVEKLSGADQISGGVGGVVNIISRKPFTEPGQHIAGSISVSDEDIGGSGNEFYGLYSNTFKDDTLGVLVSYIQSERNNVEHGMGTFSGFSSAQDFDGTQVDDNGNLLELTDGQGNVISADPNGDGIYGIYHKDPRAWQIDEDRNRKGANIVLQYRPTDDLELTLDHFWSKLESDRDRRWLAFGGRSPISNAVFSDNEVLVAGTATVKANTNIEFADVVSEVQSTAFHLEWNLSDYIVVSAEVSRGESEGTYDQQFFRLGELETSEVQFDLRDGAFGSFNYTNGFSDPADLELPVYFLQAFNDKSEDTAARVDVDWTIDHDFISSVEFGAHYQTLETSKIHKRFLERRTASVQTLVDDGFVEVFSNDDFLPGEFKGLTREFLTFNENSLNGGGTAGCLSLERYFDLSQKDRCTAGSDEPGPRNAYTIEESFISVYAKANLNFSIAGKEVTGNVGARVLSRDLDSTGIVVSEGVNSKGTFERSDTEVLPSMVFKMNVSDDLVARFGAAKVVAYGATNSLRRNVRLNRDQAPFTGSGGSPNLDPFKANQFDLSLEWYFNENSMLSGGLFYKDISTFIITQSQEEVFDGDQFLISREVNGDSAKVKGIEIAYQQPLSMILDGLGSQFTYTFIDAETPILDVNNRNLSFPGLSENSVNAVVYYEVDSFNMRFAYNWRDEYLNSIGATGTGAYFDAYEDLSFTARYSVNDNITVGFEASNLLDSELRTYDSVEEALRTNTIYGKSYKLSTSFRF